MYWYWRTDWSSDVPKFIHDWISDNPAWFQISLACLLEFQECIEPVRLGLG